MKIRPATEADIPRLVEMAEAFYATTDFAAHSPMSKPSAAGLAILCMRDGVLLVAEDDAGALHGMAVLYVSGCLFNVSLLTAEEIAWWIEPEARGGMLAVRMLKAVEQACADKGVDVIRMAALKDSPPAAIALYEKRGYARSDSHYMKVIA